MVLKFFFIILLLNTIKKSKKDPFIIIYLILQMHKIKLPILISVLTLLLYYLVSHFLSNNKPISC